MFCRHRKAAVSALHCLRLHKSRFPSLSLWTFQRNAAARRFYERQGFTLVEATDGSRNMEKEPDVLYRWPSNP